MASRKSRPPGGECHDLWGASFNGTPSHHRVLKPPGGGSSDIFGAPSEPAEPQRKNRSHLTSSIFGGEDTVTPARNKADANPVPKEAPSVNGTSSSTNSEVPTPSATPAPATAKQRVPPGGFSSGLW